MCARACGTDRELGEDLRGVAAGVVAALDQERLERDGRTGGPPRGAVHDAVRAAAHDLVHREVRLQGLPLLARCRCWHCWALWTDGGALRAHGGALQAHGGGRDRQHGPPPGPRHRRRPAAAVLCVYVFSEVSSTEQGRCARSLHTRTCDPVSGSTAMTTVGGGAPSVRSPASSVA